MERDHQKIGYTAILCARSLSDNSNIPYTKKIWQEIEMKGYGEKRISFSITNFLARFYKGIGLLHSFLEGRYLAMNRTLEKLNNPAVIEIAAGVTPRGLEFYDKNKFYIETDLPKMVTVKKDILKSISPEKNVRISALNILNKKELFQLGKYYKKFKIKKPLAIIHSGLWTYLDKEEQKVMAKNIRDFLKKYSPNGYWISSDFRPRSLQKNLFFKYFRAGITKKTGRDTTRFNSEEELNEFMKTSGFNVKRIKNKEIFEKMNSPKKFKLKIEDVLRQSQDFKVYVMTLAKWKK